MIVVYVLVSILIGWVWVDYYRLIGIYDTQKYKLILFTFILGAASVYIVYGVDMIPVTSPIALHKNMLMDFLYCFINIGIVEEFAKLVPFIITYVLFKNHFKEPIDYFAFMCFSALGFSAFENVGYFLKYGPDIINARGILSSVGHMFDSSLTAYGFILVVYRSARPKYAVMAGFFLLAALSHGIFDFLLMSDDLGGWGKLMCIFYYYFTISIFVTILNNALNNASNFTYKKVVHSDKVAMRLLSYYALIFFVQFVAAAFAKDTKHAFAVMIASVIFTGVIVVVVCIRLSRFKLIQGRWFPIKIELPFSVGAGNITPGIPSPGFSLRIKGDSYNETYINEYYEEYFYLNGVSSNYTDLDDDQLAYIEKKIFLKNDNTFYVAKFFKNGDKENFETYLLKPKTSGMNMMMKKYPIIAVLSINEGTDLSDTNLDVQNFDFSEWAYLKPTID